MSGWGNLGGRMGKLVDRIAASKASRQAPRLAQITSIRPDGVRLQFQGAESASQKSFRALAPETLRVGDTVVCLPLGDSWVVVGAAVAQTRLAWWDEFLWPSVSGHYSSYQAGPISLPGIVGAVRAQTSATPADAAYISSGSPYWLSRNPALAMGALGPDALTSVKATLGIDTLPTSQAGQHVKFWYDAADGNNWFASVGNGASFTEVDTGVQASPTRWRHFRMEVDSGLPQARFYIDGELVASIASTFPALTAVVPWWLYVETTEAVAKKLYGDYLGVLLERGY